MSQPRFHCPFPLAAQQRFELPEAIAHHAIRVLRLRDASNIILFDGQGGQYPATLHIEGRRAWAKTADHVDTEVELPVRTVLVQGIASGDKMDWIVEKAVELGVSQLVPIAAQRSVIQLSAERRAKRLQHWQRIAVSASEQCGRNRIMEVASVQSLQEWLQHSDSQLLRLACHPDAPKSLEDAVAHHTGPLALMIGPEGGWSEEELELMQGSGLTPVRFGRRVLRTETAGVALMAALAAIKRWN
ncbi:MAG TPA: 16S rRNA (uracil(1498)-N(3))-methyltransferase [Burkholderiaceae bacterium]|nr:16S rRNA (uracil(1498)-N(3))-methyltransferase [Burkholderiaceae bacterium]